jgi:MFS family permease
LQQRASREQGSFAVISSRSVTANAGRVIDLVTPPVLANLEYRRLWYAGFFYYQAYWMEIVVTGWVVLTLTGSATSVGVAAFVRTLPMLLLGVVFGSLADRFPRMTVLLGIQIASLTAAIVFAGMFFFGFERFWLMCLMTGLIGCAWAADFATRRALISELNTRETTANAMSLEALTMQGGKIIAPVVGGFMFGLAGASFAYLGLMLLFGAAIVSLLRFRAVFQGTTAVARPSVSLIDLIRSGWETAIQIPIIRMTLIITVVMNMLVFPFMQMISLIAGEILEVGPSRMGLLAGALGVGSAIIAGFLTFRGRPNLAPQLFVGGAISGALLLMLLAMSTNFQLSLTIQLVIGACFGAFGAMQPVIIVSNVEAEMRARAMGLLAMAIGTVPLGLLITGGFSSLFGPALTIGGMALVASVLLIATSIHYRSLLRS